MYPYLELIFTKTLPYKFPRHRTGEYPNGSQCFKPMFIGVHQLKPETLPNLFQEPVKSPLIPKHCAFFPKIGIEGERPSVQKASFRIQNGRIRTLSNPAPFFPKDVFGVFRGASSSNPSFFNPFRMLRVLGSDGHESFQMDWKRHHGL